MTTDIVKRRGDTVAGEVRRKMIEGAVRLLARHGLQSTSFAEVLEHTGTPRGSVYHHFPEGKDQMVGEAVDLAGDYLVGLMAPAAGAPALAVVERFLAIWRGVLAQSKCASGCAVLAVAVATDSPDLLNHAAAVFRLWRGRLAELLEQGGLARKDARRFATVLVASAEGAVVMSRAEQDIEPFETVARQLLEQAHALASAR
jgi:AcrR family transcriptional regulator